MEEYYTLNEAVKISNNEIAVEDFLKAGGNGDVALYYDCYAKIHRIELLINVNEVTGEPHFDEIYDSEKEDEYSAQMDKGYFPLSQAELKDMFYNYKADRRQFIHVSSRYDNEDERMFIYNEVLNISREAILIKEQDLANFTPPNTMKMKSNAFTSVALQKAIQCNEDLYGDDIPGDARSQTSENDRIGVWFKKYWPEAPAGKEKHIRSIIKPTDEQIRANKK